MAFAFGGQRSIQLSYGCVERGLSRGAGRRQAPLVRAGRSACPLLQPLDVRFGFARHFPKHFDRSFVGDHRGQPLAALRARTDVFDHFLVHKMLN